MYIRICLIGTIILYMFDLNNYTEFHLYDSTDIICTSVQTIKNSKLITG